jgi:hypothetical protein
VIFQSIRLYGVAGAILCGYQEAARLSSWSIYQHVRDDKHDGRWRLEARVEWVDAFLITRRRLLFTAPRDKGRWCWLVNTETLQHGSGFLVAELGQPEQ